MQGFGPASESLRLYEHYRRMTDEELIELAQYPSSLTEMAQAALAQEVHSRRLTVPPPARPPIPPPPPDEPDADDPYAEERTLVTICGVYSLRDAMQVSRILDVAGIPFYMGPEKAMSVDAVTSNYGAGIRVKVMRVGAPWAVEALSRNYEPKDEPPEEKVVWDDKVAVRCPRCRSQDVAFQRLTSDTTSNIDTRRFHWTCGACGKEWQDDGVAK